MTEIIIIIQLSTSSNDNITTFYSTYAFSNSILTHLIEPISKFLAIFKYLVCGLRKQSARGINKSC